MRWAAAALVSLGLATATAAVAPVQAQAAGVQSPDVLTFGIVPQQSASRLAKMWGPFLAELSARTGIEVRFRTTKDIPTFEACLAQGAYDIAYMNPMHYTIFAEEAGYRAIARQAKKRLKGIIVARVDSEITDLSDLAGETVAFPSPGAFGASIIPRATLAQQEVRFTPSYVKSHDSVYRAVAAGLMPAGGGVLRTFGAVDPAIRDQLQIIYETDGFTPHAIAVNGDVSAAVMADLQEVLMQIAKDQPDLVHRIGMKGFEAGADADWDDVRSLSMARAATGISQQGDVACPSD